MKVTNLNLKSRGDFYRFFNSIPKKYWVCGELTEKNDKGEVVHCALGHLGIYTKPNSSDYKCPTRQVERNVRRLAKHLNELRYDELVADQAALSEIYDIVVDANDDGDKHPKQNVLALLKA